MVPPNNQGIATPFYNQGDNGDNPRRTASPPRPNSTAIRHNDHGLDGGYIAFAGQRDDGFYADIQSVFDLLQLRSPGKDSQGGFNLHLMALAFPSANWAVTSRSSAFTRPRAAVRCKSCARIAIRNSTGRGCRLPVRAIRSSTRAWSPSPTRIATAAPVPEDANVVSQYAENPELARLINPIVFGGTVPAVETDRTDIAGIYIPDLIKVDLSTVCRLAGSGSRGPIRMTRLFAPEHLWQRRRKARFNQASAMAVFPAAGPMAAALATTWWTSR